MNQHSLLCSALLTALTATTSTAVAEDNPLKGDLAKIQGKWTATMEAEGNKQSLLLQFEGNTLRTRITTYGQKGERTSKFKIDESARPHKTMDWTTRIDPNGVERCDSPAIYAFVDDDTLKICQPMVVNERTERPKAFGPTAPAGGMGGGALIFVRFKETATTAP